MSDASRFNIGDRVRTRPGTRDPDGPDMLVEGWSGSVEEVLYEEDGNVACFVRWDAETRGRMPTAFVNRCLSEKLEIDSMWLDEVDLEPLVLAGHIAGIREGLPQLHEPFSLPPINLGPNPTGRWTALILAWAALVGGVLGATVLALSFLEGAATGMLIGAIAMGTLGGLAGRQLGRVLMPFRPAAGLSAMLGCIGVLLGTVLGMVLGALAVAFVGSVLGSILGVLIAEALPSRRRPLYKLVCGWLGACVGGVVLAYNRNPEQTVAGLVVGLPLGAIALPLVVVVVLLLFAAIWRRQ